jgi:succinyl-CoA synthetase beta subunit
MRRSDIMKLYEYQAKNIFDKKNILIPCGLVCSTEEELKDAFASVGKGKEAVLKSQVLVGGRGKSGGIRIVKSAKEACEDFRTLTNMEIKGLAVSKVLVEEKVEIINEYYIGITIDATSSKPILLISSRGGVDIETIAKESPSALHQEIINPLYGISSYRVCDAINKQKIPDKLSMQFVDITKKLYELFCDSDATLIETNPLVESLNGRLCAVDARLNIDDNAFFKHSEFRELKKDLNENVETFLKDKGVYFVNIGGNVGLICAGAGMTMATMDLINAMGGKPACFCDVSAGINPESIGHALHAVSNLNGVKSILVNMFGGLTRMDEVAKSLVEAWETMGGVSQPVVIRLEGTNVEEGRDIIKEHGFNMFTNLYDAVEKAVDLVR